MTTNAAVAQPYSRGGFGGMLADTWLLISLRWQIWLNGLRARKLYQRILFGLLGLSLVAFLVGTSGAIGLGAGALLHNFPNVNLEPVLPGLLLTAGSLLLLVSSFGSALSSLFLASDLDLLMSAPVDRRAVFLSKMLDSMGVNYAIIAMTALPALITYGVGLGYGPLYFVLALLALIGLPLLPAGLGALLVLLVARFAPARRVREVLGFFAALVGLSCSLIGQTSRFWFSGLTGTKSDLNQVLHSLEQIANIPLPTIIAGRGLAAAGAGNIGGALVGLAGFLVLTFGFFAGCVWVADSLYATGWVRMQSSGVSKRSKERAARDAAQSGLLGTAPPYLAITLKDWRVLPRDLRNFAQLLWPLVVIPVLYLNLVSGSGRRGGEGFDINAASWSGVHLTGLFIAAGVLMITVTVFTQIANNSISMEGKAWWLLKAAPISSMELLRGKFVEVMLPFGILSTLLLWVAGIWLNLNLLGLFYGWIGMLVLGAGALIVSLSFGIPWAKLEWDDPRRMNSGWGSLLSFIVDFAVAIFGGGLLCAPLLVQAFWPAYTLPAFVLGLLLSTAVTAAIAYACLQFGLSKLGDVGES